MNQTIELIKDFLTEYATYVNQTRANVALDGFKAVQRRIYYAAWNIAKDKFVKTATIVGNVLAYYHPHGDSSVADAIVGMVRNGYLIGKGNWGSKCTLEEIKPAAMRYTEVRFNKDLEWTMEYIKYAEYTLSDIDYEEPLLIPTPVPIGLIGDLVNYPQPQQGIGVGLRSVIPMFRLKDLVEMIRSLIKDEKPVMKDPYFGSYIDVESSDTRDILLTGNGKAVIVPKFDFKNKQLHIYALTKNILNIIKPWKDKLNVVDLSTRDKTHIIVEPKKYQKIDFDEVAETIIRKMKSTIAFSIYVAIPDKDKNFIVYRIGILPWLKAQFLYYIECRKKFLQSKIDQLTQQLSEYRIIKELRPYLITYLKNHPKPNPEEFINTLPSNFDKSVVNTILKKYSIRKLLSVDLDEEEIKQKINELQHQLENVIDITLEELNAICK